MADHPDISLVASEVQPIDSSGNRLTDFDDPDYGYWLQWYRSALVHVDEDQDFFFSLLQSNFVVSTSNLFLRKALFACEKAFDPFLIFCHDYEFLLRVLQRRPFGFLRQPLLEYRLHPFNTIRSESFHKRFEVQYAVFRALNFEESQKSGCDPQHRAGTLWFRGLERNPDINAALQVQQKDAVLADLTHEIRRKDQDLESLTDQIRRKDRDLESLTDQIRRKDRDLESLTDQIRRKDQDLESLTDQIRRKDRDLESLTHQIRQKDFRLDQVGHELEDMRRALIREEAEAEGLKHRIRELEETVVRLESESLGWKTRLDASERQLRQADLKILDAENRAAERQRLIEEIFASKGWKVLSRYRDIKIGLSRFLHPQPVPVPVTDEKTYPTTILRPIRPNRPKVIHALANFLTGGSSRLVVDLVEHLGDRYDQEVMSFLIPSPLAYSGVVQNDFSGCITPERVTAFLKEKKADLLHVHYWGEGDAAWYRAVFEGARQWDGILIENVNTPVVPYVSDRIDHYVYVSEYAKNFAACVEEKSSVIYPGSDLKLFDRGNTPIPDDTIGMVYRLDPDKLKEEAIQVFIEVVKRRPTTRVLIVGGGYFFDSYRRQVSEQGASAQFEFTDYVPYGALPEYYKRMSIFVAPVWKESFGQVSPFAMSMKIPVVGYRIGALPEILGDDTLLADDVDSLARIIVDLLEDRDRRIAIGERNFERVHERFSVEAMIQAYESLYGRLFAQRKG
uniref:Glycosyltransferase n=1 Tax=Desulfatirhabdium butyrativorans TaxID=340467 RepID=A0A7C4RTC2_9BACT